MILPNGAHVTKRDVVVLGAVAAFEREGLVVDGQRIADRVGVEKRKAQYTLQRLVGVQLVRAQHDGEQHGAGAPVCYYSLGDDAAAALERLP